MKTLNCREQFICTSINSSIEGAGRFRPVSAFFSVKNAFDDVGGLVVVGRDD
jgi:hypothetical protein